MSLPVVAGVKFFDRITPTIRTRITKRGEICHVSSANQRVKKNQGGVKFVDGEASHGDYAARALSGVYVTRSAMDTGGNLRNFPMIVFTCRAWVKGPM